jgi:hypothetical protein
MKRKLYKNIRNHIKTGDVIAFSGEGWVSRLIKRKTRSHISHVGVVFGVTGDFSNRRILIIESTSLSNIPDKITNEKIKGVQIHFLSHKIQNYQGKVYLFPLKQKLKDGQSRLMCDWLGQVHTKKVQYDNFQAVRSSLDFFENIFKLKFFSSKRNLNRLFCSELVGEAHKRAGLPIGNPSELTPKDIISQPYLGNPIQIVNRV